MRKNVVAFLPICIALFLLVSCMSGRPLTSQPSDTNKTYKIDYLFEHEGCKVYRFQDMGNYVYFTNCSGSVTVAKDDSTHQKTQTIITREYLP